MLEFYLGHGRFTSLFLEEEGQRALLGTCCPSRTFNSKGRASGAYFGVTRPGLASWLLSGASLEISHKSAICGRGGRQGLEAERRGLCPAREGPGRA